MTRIVYENEDFAASAQDEAFLRRHLGGHLEVRGPQLRILRMAGQLRLPDGRSLAIRSRKADGAALLAWLAYADPELAALRTCGSVIADSSDTSDFAALAARLFCIETWRAIQATGLLRSYQRHPLESATIRGRIDFARASRAGGNAARTPCVVFTRLPATPLNVRLAAAASAIARDPQLRAAAGAEFAGLLGVLGQVPEIPTADLLAKLELSRLERPFEGCAALALLILRSQGLSSGARRGSPAFLINLADLFERSVGRALRDSGLAARAKEPVPIYRGSGVRTPAAMAMDFYLPALAPGGVVIDAKYKREIAAANLQQMATYCWVSGARRAVLVVPRGMVNDRRPYLIPAANAVHASDYIRVDVAEFDITARTLSGWSLAARALGSLLLEIANASLPPGQLASLAL